MSVSAGKQARPIKNTMDDTQMDPAAVPAMEPEVTEEAPAMPEGEVAA